METSGMEFMDLKAELERLKCKNAELEMRVRVTEATGAVPIFRK